MSLAGWTEYYYLISCTLSLSFFLSCFSDILMPDWDICCGVLHSSLLVAWLCCCCCACNYWRNPRCQSCHLWQPTHAAFRSLCTNQRTSAGQSRAIVELFSCSQLAQTSPDLMLLPFTSPLLPLYLPLPHLLLLPIPVICFLLEAFNRLWGLKQMSSVFASFRCEQWTVAPSWYPLSLISYSSPLGVCTLPPPSMETLPFSLFFLYLLFWALA